MNTSLISRIACALLTTAIVFAACSNDKKKTENKSSTDFPAAEQTSNAPAGSTEPAEKAIVSFKVNDTAANTKKGTGNDNDAQLGMYTESSKQLSFDLPGDVPSRPHRGWLHVGIQHFKFEPATYSLSPGTYASFTRYSTSNAGGSSDYIADTNPENKGTECTITFSKIEKDPEGNGRSYLASGTFAIKLYNKVYSMKRDTKEELIISNGKFENVPIAGGPVQ